MDRASQRIVMVASAEGGMSIEELAVEKPDSIKKIEIDKYYGSINEKTLILSIKY